MHELRDTSTEGDVDAEPADVRHKLIITGLVIGGTLVTVGPLAGLIGSGFGLKKSFAAMSETEASRKSEVLSEGIDDAMDATNYGIAVSAAGGLLASICVVLLWRRAKRRL